MMTYYQPLGTAMNFFFILLIGTKMSRKIVEEKLTCLFGIKITNLYSGTESIMSNRKTIEKIV